VLDVAAAVLARAFVTVAISYYLPLLVIIRLLLLLRLNHPRHLCLS
jgi:hypothetical protein